VDAPDLGAGLDAKLGVEFDKGSSIRSAAARSRSHAQWRRAAVVRRR
jgi:hypothetical protein